MEFPIEKLEKTLDNGMKVILLRKPGFVRSLFMIGIPAGGMNILENSQQGQTSYPSGCAHFLEHQMFRLDGQDVTDRLAAMQAQANAFTSYTETCYYTATSADPAGPLSTLIDFVQTLDITPESVQKEKGIILSEHGLSQNRPESRLFSLVLQSLYENYPLNQEILGSVEDISNMSVEDLTRFYQTYYDPSQLVLCAVTGLPLEPLMELIERKEAEYPSLVNKKQERQFLPEPAAPAREEIVEKMDISTPYAAVGIKLDPAEDPASALRIDYIINLWLDGIFGTMNPQYQQWLDSRIISQNAGAESDTSTSHGYALFFARTEKPEEFFALVNQILDEKPLLDEEVFQALQIRNTASELRSVDDFENLAADHIRGQFIGFDPLKNIDLIRSIQLDEVNDFIQNLDVSRRTRILLEPMHPHVDGETGEMEEEFEEFEEE